MRAVRCRAEGKFGRFALNKKGAYDKIRAVIAKMSFRVVTVKWRMGRACEKIRML